LGEDSVRLEAGVKRGELKGCAVGMAGFVEREDDEGA
jgi:hypothetical protein